MQQIPQFRDWAVELLRRASTDLPEDVVAQLEASLSQEPDVTLLERAEVRKILREQGFTAAGLTEPRTATW